MKKFSKYLYMAVAVIIGATAFVSCSDDDDDDKFGAADIAGVYSGTMSAKVMTVDCKIDGTYNFTVQKQRDDEVIITIPQCSYSTEQMQGERTIPQMVITDVDVERAGSQNSGKYILEEDDFSVIVDNVRYTGSIYGTVDGSSINLIYQVTPGNMPMPINFTFTGTRSK